MPWNLLGEPWLQRKPSCRRQLASVLAGELLTLPQKLQAAWPDPCLCQKAQRGKPKGRTRCWLHNLTPRAVLTEEEAGRHNSYRLMQFPFRTVCWSNVQKFWEASVTSPLPPAFSFLSVESLFAKACRVTFLTPLFQFSVFLHFAPFSSLEMGSLLLHSPLPKCCKDGWHLL